MYVYVYVYIYIYKFYGTKVRQNCTKCYLAKKFGKFTLATKKPDMKLITLESGWCKLNNVVVEIK